MWEKVLIDDASFLKSTHGIVGCMICHEGNSSAADKETAHLELLVDPSDSECDACHSEITRTDDLNLHTTLAGFETALQKRGGNLNEGSPLSEALDIHCNKCHTTCGQCHVSRPDSLDGGFISGHQFKNPPSMKNNCIACHGSRVGNEYLGENEGVPGDLHWTQNGMTCTKCHSVELHVGGNDVTDRYKNPEMVRCEDCHDNLLAEDQANVHHQLHIGILSCQVCHSVSYKNCYNCHVGTTEEGEACVTTDTSSLDFKVGLNPLRSEERPYKYAVLRHVPISVDTFSDYGENLLPDFDAAPTWKYATPHNIQLKTPQNDGCNFCHKRPEIFLISEDVAADEREANMSVIVREVP